MGNWTQFNKNGTIENRTHNAANEILTSCSHDKNGNMTVILGLNHVYDAWNRLVQVKDGATVVGTYGYNGLNHRVKKTASSLVTTSYINENWQELESKNKLYSLCYIWGVRYIDDLVLRTKDEGDIYLRSYSLADPNWNVVAITSEVGSVQERMRYDAFGKVMRLDTVFAPQVVLGPGYHWDRTFTGQVLDSETGLMLYRNRYYHTGVGRFVTRDPIGYAGKDKSLYRYVGNMPNRRLDPMGLKLEKTGVKHCAGYVKGHILSGGIVPEHFFLMIDGKGIGKYPDDDWFLGIASGAIEHDELKWYPNVDPATLGAGKRYSICTDVLLESDCYDLIAFKNAVKDYTNSSAGSYIVLIADCRVWALDAICHGKKNSKSRDDTWWAFCKCRKVYFFEGCSGPDDI